MRCRTGYSFKAAYGHLEDVISRLKEITGYEQVAPISDRMSTFAFTRWTKLAEAALLRPIYGVEIPVVSILGAKKPIVDMWSFFAKTDIKDLHDAIYMATDNPGKEPTITMAQAMGLPGLIKIAGERLLIDEMPTPDDDFYMALSPSTPKGLVKRAKDKGLRFLASCDNYYPRESDLEIYRLALGRKGGTQSYPRHIMSDTELHDWLCNEYDMEFVDQAFLNRIDATDSCHATLRKGKLLAPAHDDDLWTMCMKGADRLGMILSAEYHARLNRELELIKQKGFEDYFYILADMIDWARERMVVGPARGSSCGSLVCYLLGITTIDPIKHDLMFERFIDINREDLPDIDVDFSDVNRHLVFEYAEQKYGKEHVGQLGSVGVFKGRSALNQIAPALQIPKWRIEKVADSLIKRSEGDDRFNNTLEDTLKETPAGQELVRAFPEVAVIAALEGHPHVASQHAAGVVITEGPITSYVALNARTRAIHCDKKAAEDLNLLKIDALGLTQLSIFERTLEMIGEKPISGWLEKLPIDDQAAFDILNKGYYSGVFQFSGAAIRGFAPQVHIDRFDDLIAIPAIVRPGPLSSGGANDWVSYRNGNNRTPTLAAIHPKLDELTKETYGVVIYQEQFMKIVHEVGNFSWEDTSRVRRLVSLRQGNEALEKFWPLFKDGCAQNNINESDAKYVWEQLKGFGTYAFNKSHSVAYAYLSYWSCWFKAHHPMEFAAATLDAEKDPDKQLTLLRELKAEGIEYVPVDPQNSTDRWKPVGNVLVGPLTAIKGIGPAKVREVISARREGRELKPGLARLLDEAQTELDSLYPVRDAVAKVCPDLYDAGIITQPTRIKDIVLGEKNVVILALANSVIPKDENTPEAIARRGWIAREGFDKSLAIWFKDDSEEIYCSINSRRFNKIGQKVIDECKPGKSLYAVKGDVPDHIKILDVKNIKYLGEIDYEAPIRLDLLK